MGDTLNIDIIDEDNLYVYICKNLDLQNKDEKDLTEIIKNIIIALRKHYNYVLNGFYEINIYPNNYKTILNISKIDEYIKTSIDLRILIDNKEKIYLKTKDLFIFKDYNEILTDGTYYYLNTSKVLEKDILFFSEFCDIILESSLSNIKAVL